MTTAHRTTGYAPLGVLFRSVDRTAAAWESSAIAGVTLGHARNLTAAGTATLKWDADDEELIYTAPSGTPGTAVDAAADLQAVKVYDANGVDWIYLDWDRDVAPASDTTQSITITTEWDSNTLQPTSVLDAGDPDYGTNSPRWWFNDIHSPTWDLTNGHNSDTCWDSPVTSHLFTLPGTYTVWLSKWENGGTRHDYEQTITVTDQEDTATVYYVDTTTGSDSDSGLTPALALQTFTAAMAKFTGDNIVVKFKRGETFTATAAYLFTHNDNTITSYYNSDGSDDVEQAAPTINFTPTSGVMFSVSTGVDDVKICHLHLVGPDSGSEMAFAPATYPRVTSNILLWDCDIEKFHIGCQTTSHVSYYQFLFGNYIHDIGYGSGGNGLYFFTMRTAIVGNAINDTTGGEHCFRVPAHDEGYVADNQMDNPATGKAGFTLRGASFNSIRRENAFTSVVRNTCSANFDAPTPQNPAADERMANVIVSGNLLRGSLGSSYATHARGYGTTWRNNIFYFTGGLMLSEDRIDQATSVEPAHRLFRAYNNTFISTAASGTASTIRIQGVDASTNRDPQDVKIVGNINYKAGAATDLRMWELQYTEIAELTSDYNLHAPGTGTYSSTTLDGGGGAARTLAATQSALSTDANSLTGDADIVDAAGGDYSLDVTSDAIGSGDDALLPWLRWDYAGHERTTNIDCGALERGAVDPAEPDIIPDPPAPPTAGADSDVTSGTVPLTVQFVSTSSLADTWSWRIDDVQFATTEDTSHVFTEPGTYQVTLLVSNEDGSDESDPITITANTPTVGEGSGNTASSVLRPIP